MEEEKVIEEEGLVEDFGFEDITGEEASQDDTVEQDSSEVVEPEGQDETVEEETVEEEIVEPVREPEPESESEPVEDAEVDEFDNEDELDEVASLRKQNEELLKHIENLSGQVVSGMIAPAAPQQAKQPKPEQPADVPQTNAEVMNFLENTSIDDLLEDPSKFNQVLNNVAAKSTNVAVQGAVQQVLRTVPELIMGYITRHSAMSRMVDDFYAENPDLVSVKQTVAAVANDVHAKNPDLGVDEVFKQSAEQTRKILGLKNKAQKAVKRKPAKPAFAKTGGARQKAPAVDPIQREINDLLSDDF